MGIFFKKRKNNIVIKQHISRLIRLSVGSPHTVLGCSRANIKALRRNGSGLFYCL